MRWATQLRLRFRALLHRSALEQELDEELRYHVERQIEEDIAAGLSPEEARLAARRALMGVESRKEECRDARGLRIIDHLRQDVRFAIRQLRKHPGFTAAAVLVSALGLCAAIAIFAYVDAALIKPLPYPNPVRLVGVTESVPLIPRANLSYLDYLDWKRMNGVFQSLDVYSGTGFLISTPTGAEPVSAARVSDGFFRTLGVSPMLGRGFSPGEDLPGAARTVVLGYGAWQKRFGGKKDIIDQAVLLSGVPHTVVGVLPLEFQFAPLGRAEFWVTLDPSRSCERRRSCHNLDGVARLKDGVTVEAALAEMKTIAQRLEKEYPDSNRGQGASVVPLSEIIVGQIRPILLMLLGGAGLLMLIACINVASLLLVRAESRRRETAMRAALGASRSRLWRQFLTEGVLLVVAGSVLGLLLAAWVIQLLSTLIPADMIAGMPFLLGLGLNARILAFAAVASLMFAVLFSLTPTVHFWLSRMREGLTEGSRGSAGLTWSRLGAKLVVLEFATAMVLLAGAGLLGKSLYLLLHVDLGFRPDHLATLTVAAPETAYGKAVQSVALAREIVQRVESLPGVSSVGLVTTLPVSFNGNTDWIRFVGRPYNGEHNEVNARAVSAGYFHTIGAKLLGGRYFREDEDQSKPRAVIINQKLAKQYFPNENPLGKQIGDTTLSPKSIKEIVGVVDDIREGSLDSEIWPAVYYPFQQDPDPYFSIVVRTAQDPGAILPALSAAIRQLHPDVGILDETTIEQRIDQSPTAYLHRSAAWLAGGFAALALLLGVVGLYGVVAYSVSQRTREIGVRMALGAAPKSLYRLILGEVANLVGVAAALGLSGSLLAATLIRGLLYGVRSWDVPTLAGVAAVLILAALLASYFPARRAAGVNPVEALRAE